MAVLGNKPPVAQSVTSNANNLSRAGFTPGQYYNAGAGIAHGFSFGVPRDWSQGGKQMYDPRFATALPQAQPNTAYYANTQGGAGARYNQFQSRPGSPKPTTTGMPTGGSFGGGQLGQISTSIQPQAIYDPWMTDVAVNQAVANADQRSNLQTLMGQFDTPGVSRSSRHAALAAPLAAQQQLTAADARARIPFEDMMANQRNLFLGQVARENEGLGLGNLSARMYEAQNQDALARMNQSLGYLQTLIG